MEVEGIDRAVREHLAGADRCERMAAEYEKTARTLRRFGAILRTRADALRGDQPTKVIALVGSAR